MTLDIKYRTLLERNDINTKLRLAHFMAQIEHESGLKPIAENLNYSKEALLRVFGKYFTPEQAAEYARKPEKIANRVYSNRMGNGDEASGEGWKFRGRGFIQLTGKDNYEALSKDVNIDYVNDPDLLLTEADAMVAALWFWNKKKLNRYADQNDIREVTRRINGGYNGLDHRKQLLKKYFEQYGIS